VYLFILIQWIDHEKENAYMQFLAARSRWTNLLDK